ncbi:hypothetical protein swp_2009 [Shewanella piezotolerans WP3]|uniref:Uncharacterized protein n=1 Tax=Shewanella piezotolerans (strain WP3 / JCM 13877) TaxID=225849 RepID=B8CND1_SHEPW|nr:hypothetical protein swp_2009 [Shewanella piezotolerans WP3]
MKYRQIDHIQQSGGYYTQPDRDCQYLDTFLKAIKKAA